MKNTTISEATALLETMFDELNADLFEGALHRPIITIQSTPKYYGHISVQAIWATSGDSEHELNIGAEALDRPIEEVVSTMIHEMTHLDCMARNIKDTSRSGQYHNKTFKYEAERHMVSISQSSKYGWTVTNPTPELCDYVKVKGWERITLSRKQQLKAPGTKSNSRKYVCPCCNLSVRATKEVAVACMECDMRMELEC